MRVYIVDDEVGICRHLQRELKKEGYDVKYTTSSVNVLKELKGAEKKGYSYDLLLLDIRMPKMSGLKLLEKIREARLDLDTIIITGHGDEDIATESIRLGAVDYLRKPISLEELHTAIFRVQQKRAEREKKALEHRILIVDDEKELCTHIKRELEKEGYQVAVAYDGAEGLEHFKNYRVDLAIVDIKMPEMSGLEMLERCREITDDFVSIIITGHGYHEKAIEALKLGVLNYLRKPISLEELVTSVSKGIDLLYLRRGLSARRRELEIETALKEQYAKNLEKIVEKRTKEIKKLSDAVKASSDSIVISDLEGKITDVNEATLKMYGIDYKADLIGKTSFDIFIPEDREKALAGMKEVMEKGYIKDREYHILIKDGSKIPVEMSTSIMKGLDGEPIGFVGIMRDITERKQAEEKIKAKSLFLESLIQQSPLPTFVMDSKGFVVMVNEAFLKFYAVPNKEMVLGRNALTEPANVRHGVIKYFREALSGKIVEIPEIEFVSPYKNKKVITRGRLFPILDPTGTLTNVVVMQEDITKRKQAEVQRAVALEALQFERSQLLSIFDSVNEIIYVVDPKTYEILYANRALKDAIKEDLVGGLCYKKFQGFEKPCEFCTNEIIMKEKGKPYRWEYHNPILERDYMITDRIIKWPDGRDVRFELAIDISERKQAEEALRKSEEKYRLISESTSDSIATTTFSLKPTYTYISPSIKTLIGYEPEELIGKSALKLIHPDDKKKFIPLLKGYLTERAKLLLIGKDLQVSESIEYRAKDKSGNWHYIQSTVNIIGDELLFVSRDITERKQSEEARRKTEEHYRKTIENIFKFVPEGLLVFTDKVNLFKQNKAFQDIVKEYANKLNYTKQELVELIVEQVKNRIINKDYADIRIPKNKDRKTKNKQNNL